MRLIDAEALEEEIVKTQRYVPKDAVLDVACMVNRAPTIEAKPVVHAHWKGGLLTSLRCSNCGETALGTCFEEEFMSNYCPNCGAQMDEVVSEENATTTNNTQKMRVDDHIAEGGKKEAME